MPSTSKNIQKIGDKMQMRKIRKYSVISLLLTLILAVPVLSVGKISPAVDIIAADYTMAKSGLVGQNIEFTKTDFKEALGVSSVGKITITGLPASTEGTLKLGSQPVSVGQVISERNLDVLKFVPLGGDEITAKFTFRRGKNTGGMEYECALYTLKAVNLAPSVNGDKSVSTDIPVYSGVTFLGTVPASDPEGDTMTFEIISDAAHGKVKLTDRKRGYFEYTSAEDYKGRDSFTVRVTDKYGNRSETAKIILSVSPAKENEVFADMGDHWATSAVITCVREGIIEGASVGEKFYPDEYLSRGEFLHLAMNAAGCNGFTGIYTGFADDSDIPAEYKGSVALAETLGIIDGVETETGLKFYPNNQITRCEAAVILSRITGISAGGEVAVFADSADIPVWAVSAMQGLHSKGILRGMGEGRIGAYSSLTRGAAAQMIASAIMY